MIKQPAVKQSGVKLHRPLTGLSYLEEAALKAAKPKQQPTAKLHQPLTELSTVGEADPKAAKIKQQSVKSQLVDLILTQIHRAAQASLKIILQSCYSSTKARGCSEACVNLKLLCRINAHLPYLASNVLERRHENVVRFVLING